MNEVEKLEEMMKLAKKAQKEFATFNQEQVDAIFTATAIACTNARIKLSLLAAKETGMGIAEDKVIKNHFASEFVYNKYKNEKTCGVLSYDPINGVRKIAEPIGIIAGVVPTTNPTSTAIFKSLLALKTRNAIVFSPHPRAKESTNYAVKIIHDAAVAAGAPEGIVQCIKEPTVELSGMLMRHPDINLILATGGPGMVKAAYSSGKPALGVGAGNTPAVIDATAEIPMAVNSILMSKNFDNGVICASEQSVIIEDSVYEEVKTEFIKRGAHICTKKETDLLRKIILKDGTMSLNSAIVGQPAYKIAEMAGFAVPEDTKVLIGEVTKINLDEPFAHEKLSPTLAMYRGKNYKECFSKALELVELGGIGHTSVLYTAPHNEDRITEYGTMMKTGRILINQPSSQGAIGDVFNFRLEPSLTLGCGSWGGNSVSENVGVKHLMNIKTVTERRENMLWFRVPPKIFYKYGCLPLALREIGDRKRAFIVTDKPLYDLGYPQRIMDELDKLGIAHDIFHEVLPDPDLKTIYAGVERMNQFKPDVIIALGGGSPMDAAKMMWLMYEHPEVKFEDLAMRFMDILKRVCSFPEIGKKAMMVAIPTTSGTGSEVTPFAVVTDESTGIKYPIADYALTPNMAIVDPDLTLHMPKSLTAFGGVDAIVHALEAIVSIVATEFSDAVGLDALEHLFGYLERAYVKGGSDPEAREKVHYGATLAGMAFANAFLGIAHSMAHKLGAAFHIPHGLANALVIKHVIRYNATEKPFKQGLFSQYEYPQAIQRYAKAATRLGLKGKTDMDKVNALIEALDELMKKLNIPGSIKEAGVEEAAFLSKVDELAEMAFDDQCTSANPRYPLIGDLKKLYIAAYYGTDINI